MKCPKCGHEFKSPGQKAGGHASKRKISPEAQAKMQAARANKKKQKKE